MPSLATAAAVVVSGLLPVVLAQAESNGTPLPLASQSFSWANLPYQVNPYPVGRGPQAGYNICNSTTEGPTSMCQTAVINSIDDFCLWGPPDPNDTIGDTEGGNIAWCTKAGYGTRVIPQGTLTAVQFLKAPAYVQVTGWINQQFVDIDPNDGGGELDPHGADELGNPIGGLLFSNAWGTGPDGTAYKQAIQWHSFMGGGQFCLKACDPGNADAAHFCEHIYDRIGCAYNAPAAYAEDVFLSCLSDNQDFPGTYTGADGSTTVYQQPPESDGVIQTMPYTARIPASSSCTTYTSSVLYAGAPTHSSVSSSATATHSSSAHSSSHTTTGSHTTTSGTNGAGSRAVVSVGALVGAALLAAVAL